MSIVKYKKCDECGDILQNMNEANNWSCLVIRTAERVMEVDLCPKCYEKLSRDMKVLR